MSLQEDYNGLLEKDNIEDNRELGYRLVKQLLVHIGMIRYHATGIKDFDINASELGKLVDKINTVIDVLKSSESNRDVKGVLGVLIVEVDNLEETEKERSVISSLKESFRNEIRKMNRNIDYSDLWEF